MAETQISTDARALMDALAILQRVRLDVVNVSDSLYRTALHAYEYVDKQFQALLREGAE